MLFMKNICIWQLEDIIFQIISMILLFFLVHSKEDVALYSLTTLVSLTGYNVLNIMGLPKKFQFNFQTLKSLKKHFYPIMLLFANSIATTIYINSDTTILGLLAGNISVGLYSVATKVYSIVKNILASVIIVTIPKMSKLWSDNKSEEFNKLGNKILNSFFMLTLPAMLGIYLLSNEIIEIISDYSYLKASSALRILSIALLISVFNWFFQSSILIPSKNEKKVLYATSAAAIVNIILNFILIPKYKQDAAAITTLLAELISVFISWYYSRKIIKIKLYKKDIISILGGCVYIYIYFKVIESLISNILIKIILIIVGAGIGYFIILMLLGNTIVKNGIVRIWRKILG